MIRAAAFVLPIALLASACATAPIQDERAMATEVFQLSGGLQDLKVMARFAPMMLGDTDVKQKCIDALGRNPNALALAACDLAESAARRMRAGQGGLQQALETQITRMESHAVDAMVATYTAEELAAMRRYYSSDAGRAIVAKRSEYLGRLMGGP